MKKMKVLLVCFSAAAIILECLPFGAVCVFADDGETMRRTFSYFSRIPFGYANFAPLITAILTCVVFVLGCVSLFKADRGIKAAAVVSGIAAVISLAPLLYGVEFFSVVGGLISAALAAAFVLALLCVKKIKQNA